MTPATGHTYAATERAADEDYLIVDPATAAAAERPDGLDAIVGELTRLLQGARNVAKAKAALAEARALVSDFADHVEVRSSILQLRAKAGDTIGLLQDLEALFQECPADRTIFELYLRRLIQLQANGQALELLSGVLPLTSSRPAELIERAELLNRIHAFTESDATYARILSIDDQKSVRVSWAKRLAKRALFEDAGLLLEGSVGLNLTGEKAKELLASIDSERTFFQRFRSSKDLRGKDFRLIAMELAILRYSERDIPATLPEQLKVQLVTGNLGAGGAERQFCGLSRLIQAHVENRETGTDPGFASVELVVKEHTRPGVSDFFLDDLRKAGVPVHQMNEMKPVAAHHQAELDADMAHLLKMLPPQVHFGVVRLAPHLRMTRPDVVSLWQDGSCLIGALAALFAGVPRIQLMFRGLPPNIRVKRYKPEYELLYNALATIPGVEFVCNSRSGAIAYAEWLGMPLERFEVLYNGVEFPPTAGDPSDHRIWGEFAARTADATETIGGVFRLEPDKRPLHWIRMAAVYVSDRPKARFVIVGDGSNMADARNLVAQLKLEDRLLFVGKSNAVGFWYDKMDIKVLLSRFEGLPNVLIEAQYFGCPVVSTPAGGAAECFDPGSTGHVLDCAENPCMDQACEWIREYVDRRRHDPEHIATAARSVVQRFHVDRQFEKFHAICRLPLRSLLEG